MCPITLQALKCRVWAKNAFCTFNMLGLGDKRKRNPSIRAVEAAEAEAEAAAAAPPTKVRKVVAKISGTTGKVIQAAKSLSRSRSSGSRVPSEAGSTRASSPEQEVEVVDGTLKTPAPPKNTASTSKTTSTKVSTTSAPPKSYTQRKLLVPSKKPDARRATVRTEEEEEALHNDADVIIVDGEEESAEEQLGK